MSDFGKALAFIICTPQGWIGLLIVGAIVGGIASSFGGCPT